MQMLYQAAILNNTSDWQVQLPGDSPTNTVKGSEWVMGRKQNTVLL